MEGNWPLVTVFTLIYNTNPKYVIEAIDSIRANNYPNLQHIIIDDCSPDPNPKEVVKKWIADNNYVCEFYEHEVNYGVCKTLNHVLDLAKGKYILGCSDDILTKDRILNDVELLEKLGEKYAICFGMSQVMNENSELQFMVITNISNLPADHNYFKTLIHGNMISAPSATIRTEVLSQVGGYDEYILYEDYDMWLKLSYSGYLFAATAKINSYYRVHSNGLSNNVNSVIEDFKCIVKYIKEDEVRELIENRLVQYGFYDRQLYQTFIQIYKKYSMPSIRVIIAGYNLPKLVKRIFLKILKVYTRW